MYEVAGYDNTNNVFVGVSNVGKSTELTEGTYYYVIDKGDGSQNETGFIVLKY